MTEDFEVGLASEVKPRSRCVIGKFGQWNEVGHTWESRCE